jgi:alkylhydroperoxidase family enzyme
LPIEGQVCLWVLIIGDDEPAREHHDRYPTSLGCGALLAPVQLGFGRPQGHEFASPRVAGTLNRKVMIMSTYRVHSIDSAPEKSRPALQDLKKTFGFIPNVAGAMAESPVLLDAFAGVFHKVHSGTFTEPQVQTLLLTNAVTNTSAWPVALHSKLALEAGVAPADVQAIRERRLPEDSKLAALSGLTRAMIEKRGHLDERDLATFREAGFRQDQVLEVITVVAASAMTNCTASITEPPVEAPLQAHVWKG